MLDAFLALAAIFGVIYFVSFLGVSGFAGSRGRLAKDPIKAAFPVAVLLFIIILAIMLFQGFLR